VAYTPGREGTDLAEPARSKSKLAHAAVSGKGSQRKIEQLKETAT